MYQFIINRLHALHVYVQILFFIFLYVSVFWTYFMFSRSRMEKKKKVYYYFWLLFYTFSAISRQQKHYSINNFFVSALWYCCLDSGQLMDWVPSVVWALHQIMFWNVNLFLGTLIFSTICKKVHVQDLQLLFLLEQPQCANNAWAGLSYFAFWS